MKHTTLTSTAGGAYNQSNKPLSNNGQSAFTNPSSKPQPLKPSKKINVQIKSPRSQMQSHITIGTKNYQNIPPYNQMIKSPTLSVDNYGKEQVHTQRVRHVANENIANQSSGTNTKINQDFKHSKSTKVSPKRHSIVQQSQQNIRTQVQPASQFNQQNMKQNIQMRTQIDKEPQNKSLQKYNNDIQSSEAHMQDLGALTSDNFAQISHINNNNMGSQMEQQTFEVPLQDHSVSIHSSFANMIYPSKSKKMIVQQISLKEETFNPQQFQKQDGHHQKSKSVLVSDFLNPDQQVHAQKVQHSQYKKQPSVFNYSQRLKQLLSEEDNQYKNRHLFSQQPSPQSKKTNLSYNNRKSSINNLAEKQKCAKQIRHTFDDGDQSSQQPFSTLVNNMSSTDNNVSSTNYTVSQPISHTIDYYDHKPRSSIASQIILKQQQEILNKAQGKKLANGQPVKNNYVIDIGSYNHSKENSRERQYSHGDQNQVNRQPSREKKQHQPTQSKIVQNNHYGVGQHQRSISDYSGQYTQDRYSKIKQDTSKDTSNELSITPTNAEKGSSFLKQYSQSFLDVNSNHQPIVNFDVKSGTKIQQYQNISGKSSFAQDAKNQQKSKERQNQSYLDQKSLVSAQAKNIYQQRKASYQPTTSLINCKKSPPRQSYIYKENQQKQTSQNCSKVFQKQSSFQQPQSNYTSNNIGIAKYQYQGNQSKVSQARPIYGQYKGGSSSVITSPVSKAQKTSLNASCLDNKLQQHNCGPSCYCKKPQHSHSTATLNISHKRSKSDLQSTILAQLGKNHFNQQHEAAHGQLQQVNQSISLIQNYINQNDNNNNQQKGEKYKVGAKSSQVTPRKMYQQPVKRSVANVSIDLSRGQSNQRQKQQYAQQNKGYQQMKQQSSHEELLGKKTTRQFQQNEVNSIIEAQNINNSHFMQRKGSYVQPSMASYSPNNIINGKKTFEKQTNKPVIRQNSGERKDSSLFLKHKNSQKYSAQISPNKNNNMFYQPSQIISGENLDSKSISIIGQSSSNLISPVNQSNSFVNMRQNSNPKILHNISFDSQIPKSQRYLNYHDLSQNNIQNNKSSQKYLNLQKQNAIEYQKSFYENHHGSQPLLTPATEVDNLLKQINQSYQPNISSHHSKSKSTVQDNQSMMDKKIFMDIENYLQKQNNNNNQLFKITETSVDQNYQETTENNIARRYNDQNHKNLKLTHLSSKQDTLPSNLFMTTDPNQSPLSKDLYKLKKVIKLNFKKYKEPPVTTSEFYRIGRVLGRGAFGKVNLAAHKLSEQLVAIKSINKEFLKSEKDQKTKIMQEFGILKQSCHPSVVRLYDSFETNQHICFVMELCSGGDLLTYVRKRRKLKEDVAKHFFKQLMEGLAYIHHSKLIVHRDIKLDNILLDSEGRIKIADFGVSRQVSSETEKMHEQCGTPAYIAPEILKDKGYEGFKVDVWSAGVCLYAMLVGTVPFKAAGMHELHSMIINGKYDIQNENLSDPAKDLITKLMCVDPKKRLNAYEVLSHPWLKDVKNELDIFTQKEKDLIYKEYLSKNINRQNRNNNNNLQNTQNLLLQTNNLETEVVFTEHNLDTKTNEGSFLKNASTKSIILAPFNSTISDFDEDNQYEWPEEIKSQLLRKKVIKFSAKCRDINRQYEQNNNADLDNGVYNQFVNDQEKEEEAQQQNPLNNSNGSQGSLEKSFKETELSSDDEKADQQVEIAHEKMLQQQSDLKEFEQQIQCNYVKYQEPVEEIDQDIIEQICGVLDMYPHDYMLLSLKNKEMNYATATYNLICKKQQSMIKMIENMEQL